MRAHQSLWTASDGWTSLPPVSPAPDVVLVFGGRVVMTEGHALEALAKVLPRERFFGCSTAGEIAGAQVHDDTVVATSLWFDRTEVVSSSCTLDEVSDAKELGKKLVERIDSTDLVHAFVLSDGLQVNGSDLAAGLRESLPSNVTLTGGLSGDAYDMKTTLVCHEGRVERGLVSLLGFKGSLEVGIGSLGGWDQFGPSRVVTRSSGNVLYELDGEPALALYKRYLGPHASGLPASALLFPLLVRTNADAEPVVRTILAVDEAAGSMTFAGDVPQGAHAQLMRANFERIIEAGEGAALATRADKSPEFAVLISCMGRKRILGQRTDEELEAVRDVLGEGVPTTGFYSYGELAPSRSGAPCLLHNQTMTITTFSER